MTDPDDHLFDFALTDSPYRAPVAGAAVLDPGPELQSPPLDGEVTVNYLGEVGALLKDCDLIRKHAMQYNKRTGKWQIYNPVMFEKAVARRQAVLSAAVKLHADLMNQAAQVAFYRLVIETIAAESPGTAARLITALRRINSPIIGAGLDGSAAF
jgi:hypothetical protein